MTQKFVGSPQITQTSFDFFSQNDIYSTKLSHTAFIFDRIVKAHIILPSSTRKAISATELTKAPNPLGQFYQLWSIWLAVKEMQWCNNREIYYLIKKEV